MRISQRPHVGVRTLAAGLVLALGLVACGETPGDEAADVSPPVEDEVDDGDGDAGNGEETISSARCDLNRAAGRVNFNTGFFFAAAAAITDVVAADELGYFEELCLDVRIRPGNASFNLSAIAAGDIQVTTMTSAGQAGQNIVGGAPVTVVYIEGRQTIRALVTLPEFEELTQLRGETKGVKQTFWPEIEAMFNQAGLDRDDVREVQVGFDPRILGTQGLAALPVFKSNEVFQLEQEGMSFNLFDPEDFGVVASFGTFVFRRDFANRYPTAVEDFLRAIRKGFDYAVENPEEAVNFLEARATEEAVDFNRDLEEFRWATESRLVLEGVSSDLPLGVLDLDRINAELELLQSLGALEDIPDTNIAFDGSFARAIYDDNGELIWPPTE